jgi:chemotaxis protein methyltransferase CheR
MPESKKVMLEARLKKRMRDLGIESFGEYCSYLFSPEGTNGELVHMIDVVTTNKTDFLREPKHYDYLVQTALPELINRHGATIGRRYTVWSAGCSTGEEPYTLAMVLSEFAEKQHRFYFSILATDISTKVLEMARLGIYSEDVVSPVPAGFKIKYLLKNRDKYKRLVRIVPELRALVEFRRLNFMEGGFGLSEPVDIIFCRNVLIYFDRQTQEELLNRFYRHMNRGGYLFLGHSETIQGMNVPLIQAAPTVYRKPELYKDVIKP